MTQPSLPVPDHFDSSQVGAIWRVPYQDRAAAAELWAREHTISPADRDTARVCLVAVDVQNTFCIPGFELYVGGRSGTAAVDDNRRLCEFIYRNLAAITRIVPTMDTHRLMAVFHAIHLVDENGQHPPPFTLVSHEDVTSGRWRFNPALAPHLGVTPEQGQRYLLHYTRALKESDKYELTIWPYHAMLGGIGHALVSALEEAVFFHSVARYSQPEFQIKGDNPFTEHYSVLGPEVTEGPDGKSIARRNQALVENLLEYDAVIIAGQAKSHCVAWTIADLLSDVLDRDHRLAKKVYLLEDCTSPVVIPGAIDYTEQADEAFQRFSDAGMHVVRSTDPIANWPGIKL
jgi:nicotinamidase-related amidase